MSKKADQNPKPVHMLNLKQINRFPISSKNSEQVKRSTDFKSTKDKQSAGHSNLLNKKSFVNDYYTQKYDKPKRDIVETPKQSYINRKKKDNSDKSQNKVP